MVICIEHPVSIEFTNVVMTCEISILILAVRRGNKVIY